MAGEAPARSAAKPRARVSLKFCALLAAVLLVGGAVAIAQGPKRARPPKFPKRVTDVFFVDANKTLVGPRPQAASTVAGDHSRPAGGTDAIDGQSAAPSGTGWSSVIAPETLEDEIKATVVELAASVQSAPQFKSGAYKAARVQFSMIATMFGIISQYENQVRWKAQSAPLRDLVARAGFNCKVGTDAAYKEAAVRKDDLEGLVRGGTPQLRAAPTEFKWPAVSDRTPLMQRMERAQQQGLAVWTSNQRQFESNQERVLHEAQIVAALAEVIQQEGYEFADDDAYLNLARSLKQHAQAAAEAAKKGQYDAARAAVGEIEKSCSKCHEDFRS